MAQCSALSRALDRAQRKSLRGVVTVGGAERDDCRDEPAGVGHGLEVRRAVGQRRDLAGVRTLLQPRTGEVGEQSALIRRAAGDRSQRRGLGSDRMKAPDVAPCRGQASIHDAHRQLTVAAGQFDAIEQPEHRRAMGGIQRRSVPGGNRGGEAHLPIGSDTRGLDEAIRGLGAPEALLGSS